MINITIKRMTQHKFISILLTLSKYQHFVNNIISLGKQKQSFYVCVINVHMCIETYKAEGFVNIINNACFAAL